MKKSIATLLLVSGALGLAIAFGMAKTYQDVKARSPTPPQASSTLKILLPNGHGSAASIGNGRFLTAGHVVTDNKTVKLKTSLGAEVDAEVLWVSPRYDVALLKATTVNVKSTEIDCSPLVHGASLEARGNPGPLEFISTWGKAAGANTNDEGVTFDILDITVAPGMSGGGVYGSLGKLRGIVHAVALAPTGFSASFVPLTYIVPAKVICELLDKEM